MNPSTDRGSALAGAVLASAALLSCCVLPLLALAGVGVLTGGASSGGVADVPMPSVVAVQDIPPATLAGYITAAQRCIGLSWPVLAAVGKVDTDHGRPAEATTDSPARQFPTSPIRIDESQWISLATDGDDDGLTDPRSAADVLATAVTQLCPAGRIDDLSAALRRHRTEAAYVEEVARWARQYTDVATSARVGAYRLPFDRAALTDVASLSRPHHDYPAVDISLPAGTAVYAITSGRVIAASADNGACGGTIVLAGTDGATYTYCHLSVVFGATGSDAVGGDLIGRSGGQPGAPGAGNTTGPHLHLQVRVDGTNRCPQALVVAIAAGRAVPPPSSLPSTGCVS